jgi:formylglycine-generating enzyme required for sulfatase activity
MSKYEVTNEEYKRFDPKHTVKDFHGHHIDLPTQPAVFVSWNDAKKYAAWLTSQDKEHEYRLPTEAEWEYAARAGTTTARYWGDDPDKASSYANTADEQFERLDKSAPIHHCDDGFVVSAPVGQFEPNKFGLYDMLGNVWEWCEDTYEDNAYRTLGKNNPIELNSSGGKVLRGGSWRYGPDNVRSAQRAENKPGDQQANIGFRLVRISIGQGPAVLAAQKEDPSNPVQDLGKGLKKIDSFLKSLPF